MKALALAALAAATLALVGAGAAAACDQPPPLVATCGLTATGATIACETEPLVSSSPMIRVDGDDTVVMVPDTEILSTDVGTRSLANGWKPAYARVGHVDGGTNVGIYTFSGTPGAATGVWTDDTGSSYDAPQTGYANPVVS